MDWTAREWLEGVMTRTVVGGLIGGISSGILVFLVLGFLLEALIIFSFGGFLGGALFGIILGIPYKDIGDKKVGAVIGGGIGGVIGCLLVFVIPYVYAGTPWPSPQPYPDAQTQKSDGAVGSWGLSRVQTYTTTLSINEMEHYYQSQLAEYCVEDTGHYFGTYSKEGYEACLVSQCEIPRLGLAQSFKVELCSVSELETLVVHVDSWED